ncbi:MAG: hypothetical protein M1409_03050 [Actinobacteria bacterium]|nr:hypothetical protein [Actinomycetota bacterium]
MELNTISLWIILGLFVFVFLLGFFLRISIWLRGSEENETDKSLRKSRIDKFFRYVGIFFKMFFSRRFISIVKSFFIDGIVHRNLFKDSILKWSIHIFMFWGLASFTLITVLHVIAIIATPNGVVLESAGWYIRVFGTLENRFTALVFDLSKLAILSGAFLAVLRFLFLRKKLKSVELKDKSAGVIISVIAVFSFLYEAAFFLSKSTPASKAVFAPVGFILSTILSFIGIKWVFPAEMFFYIYIILLFLFVSFIPYGKYSHMVFGPIVAVFNKLDSKQKTIRRLKIEYKDWE